MPHQPAFTAVIAEREHPRHPGAAARAGLAIAVAALTACGVNARAATALPNPCVVLTVKDAASVLTSTPAQARPDRTGDGESCLYSVKHMSLQIETRPLASAAAFLKTIRLLKGVVLPVAGLNDTYSAAEGKELLLWHNGVEATILFTGVDPVFATQQTLASTALGRL